MQPDASLSHLDASPRHGFKGPSFPLTCPMTKRLAYEWLLEWGVIDQRHEQSILRWNRIHHALVPPLCHFQRVIRQEISFGYLLDITWKCDSLGPGYHLETLERLCRDPDHVARIHKTCDTNATIIRRYETPTDEIWPLYRWLLHWAYLWPRDEWAIERYIEAQANPGSPHGIWLDLHLSAEEEARLRSLLVSTTEAAALSLTQQEQWSHVRFAPGAVADHLFYFEEGWPYQPPYTNDGEEPFLHRPRHVQQERLAAIKEENARWNSGVGSIPRNTCG